MLGRTLTVRVRADNLGVSLRACQQGQGQTCRMELEMAKTKCIHPDRPMSKACPDCPRRGKFVAQLEAIVKEEELEMAKKTKCIHPERPISKACPDCPRRGKFVAFLEEQMKAQEEEDAELGSKDKCIHPDRPMTKACADCPRRRRKLSAGIEVAEAPAAVPCGCAGLD